LEHALCQYLKADLEMDLGGLRLLSGVPCVVLVASDYNFYLMRALSVMR
jgi:hypothetical protein